MAKVTDAFKQDKIGCTGTCAFPHGTCSLRSLVVKYHITVMILAAQWLGIMAAQW